MTLVRVNEETFNPSHSSNLISTIWLENSSPTSWGRLGLEGTPVFGLLIHCWESKREHFRVWRGSHFCRARACIPRLQTSTEIEAARTTLKAGRTVRIEQVVQQEEQAQKSRSGPVIYCRKFWEEFWGVGSFSCVKNWHGCRDKFVI